MGLETNRMNDAYQLVPDYEAGDIRHENLERYARRWVSAFDGKYAIDPLDLS